MFKSGWYSMGFPSSLQGQRWLEPCRDVSRSKPDDTLVLCSDATTLLLHVTGGQQDASKGVSTQVVSTPSPAVRECLSTRRIGDGYRDHRVWVDTHALDPPTAHLSHLSNMFRNTMRPSYIIMSERNASTRTLQPHGGAAAITNAASSTPSASCHQWPPAFARRSI